jgi:hypothetical protein
MTATLRTRAICVLGSGLLWATPPSATSQGPASLLGSVQRDTKGGGLSPVDLGGGFGVPILPLNPMMPCTITLDGNENDWPPGSCGAPARLNLSFQSGQLMVTSHLYVSHVGWTSADPDTLYVYIGATDATNNGANDVILLMLDTKHTHGDKNDDVGLCFRRNGQINKVKVDPTGACSTSVSGLTGVTPCVTGSRACIATAGGQWSVEAKLVPGDFELDAFGGVVGGLIRAVDPGGPNSVAGPGGPTLSVPASWANFTLGVAVDVALVLDLSGSMGDAIPCTSPCVSCPAPCTRLKVLKSAAQEFVDAYRFFAWKADRITVRYFQTAVSSFPGPGELVNLLLSPVPCGMVCADAVIGSIAGTSANNLTALGPGLLAAIGQLAMDANPGRKAHIIVFSDGMQNVGPFVVEIPETAPGDGYAAGDLEIGTTRLDGATVPKIHTLGIDGLSAYMALMKHIGQETGGENQLTTDAASTMIQMFLGGVETVLKNRSPQLVAYRRGMLSADTAVEQFTVNAGVTRILLELSRAPSTRLSFQVLKDGRDVTESGHTITRDSYQMFIMDLPTRAGPDTVTAGGRWDLVIKGQPGTPYHAAAIVDEPRLTYEVSAGQATYAVGEPIQLTAEISLGGKPIDDAAVTATVGRPGQGIGTLLSVNPTPTATPQNQPEPAATPAQKKFRLLLEDEKLWRTIQPSGRTVRLTSIGGGKYSGTFMATEVEGQYPVTFQVDGSDPEIGRYQRTRTVTALARFDAADFGASDVRVRTITQTPAGRQVILHLRPRDRFGNYLGPDFADQIEVTVNPGSVGADKQDLVDGGYDIPLLVPPGSDPEVTIDVVGHRLFKGPLSTLEEGVTPAFAASLHAGVSVPHGSFGTSLNTGFGITADLAYHLPGRPVDLELLAGYHRFGGAGASPDVKLFHLSGSGKLFLTQGLRAVYVEAGIGAYDLSPGPTEAGIHAGAGVQFNLWPRAALEGLYRLHSVFTSGSNSTFSSIQVGGRVRF